MRRIIKAILYPIIKDRLNERMQAELNRDHKERLGWYVHNHEYYGKLV